MENKQKLIKSGMFAAATILVLIVATVAWFMSGGNADVNNVQAEVDPGLYSSNFYESPDTDKNGEMDDPATWVAVTDPVINLNNMVPGETHYYKIMVNINNKPLDLSLTLRNIVTSPLEPTTKEQLLKRIHVAWEVKNNAGATIAGSPISGTMFEFFGNDPDLTEKSVYNSFDISAYTNTTVTIYYTIGVVGFVNGDAKGADDILQGSSFSIGNFNLALTEK